MPSIVTGQSFTLYRDLKKIEEAKRSEIETQKSRFQLEISALQQQLTQVSKYELYLRNYWLKYDFFVVFQSQNTLRERKRQHEEHIFNLEERMKERTNVLKSDYECRLKSEIENIASLRAELGITRKKLAM